MKIHEAFPAPRQPELFPPNASFLEFHQRLSAFNDLREGQLNRYLEEQELRSAYVNPATRSNFLGQLFQKFADIANGNVADIIRALDALDDIRVAD